MSYDPFARGPHPVGVTTLELSDPERSRPLPTEVWYPAAESMRGCDLDPETQDSYDVLPGFPQVTQQAVRGAEADDGTFPLVVFSHGYGGHRRQTTHLCAHLASHGYVVAAPDHTGNTIVDMMQLFLEQMRGGEQPDEGEIFGSIMVDRPKDASFVIDSLLVASPAKIDAARIGISGHSFGGWTTLMTAARDRRVRVALPLAPAGGPSPLPTAVLEDALDWDWGRDVPTLYLVADRDTLLPLDGMRVLLEKTPSTKRMVILENADHMHFCDNVEATHEMFRSMPPPALAEMSIAVPPASELSPGEHAYQVLRGVGLAHFDSVLRDNEAAAAFVTSDLSALFAERGIAVSVC